MGREGTEVPGNDGVAGAGRELNGTGLVPGVPAPEPDPEPESAPEPESDPELESEP